MLMWVTCCEYSSFCWEPGNQGPGPLRNLNSFSSDQIKSCHPNKTSFQILLSSDKTRLSSYFRDFNIKYIEVRPEKTTEDTTEDDQQ